MRMKFSLFTKKSLFTSAFNFVQSAVRYLRLPQLIFLGALWSLCKFSDRNAQLACQSCTPCEHSYDFLFLHEINSPEFVSIIGLRRPPSYRSVQKSVQNLEYLHGDLSKKIP